MLERTAREGASTHLADRCEELGKRSKDNAENMDTFDRCVDIASDSPHFETVLVMQILPSWTSPASFDWKLLEIRSKGY